MRKQMLWVYALCLALLLCGCGGQGSTDLIPASPEPTAVPAPAPTETPEPSAFPEPTDTAEPMAAPEPIPTPGPRPGPQPGKQIRAAISFEAELSLDEGVALVEKALGHELDVVRRMETANAVSVWIAPGELETIRQLEGVRSAEEEILNSPGGTSRGG